MLQAQEKSNVVGNISGGQSGLLRPALMLHARLGLACTLGGWQPMVSPLSPRGYGCVMVVVLVLSCTYISTTSIIVVLL